MITQKIDLNLIHGQVRPRVNVSQFDSGTRTIEVAVYNNTSRFTLLGTYNVSIEGRKPDNTAFQYNGIIDTVNNVATFDVTEQMTAVYGDVVVEMVINDGDDRIGTGNFILAVEAAPLNDDSVISESVLPLVQRAAKIAETIEDTVLPIRVEKDFAPVITTDDAMSKNAIDIKAKIDPVQDLHGYASPWVGGAGKNIMPLDLATLKSLNAGGTWSNNRYSLNSMTFDVLTDNSGNVTGITVNGTASAATTFQLTPLMDISVFNGKVLNGNSINDSTVAVIRLEMTDSPWTGYSQAGSDATIGNYAPSTSGRAFIRVFNGKTVSNKTFYPMISASGGAFEPYTNICPISGHSEAKITRAGKNLLSESFATNRSEGITVTNNADGSITISGTHTAASGTTQVQSTNNKTLEGNFIVSLGEALPYGDIAVLISKTTVLSAGGYKYIATSAMQASSVAFSVSEQDAKIYPYLWVQIQISYAYPWGVTKTFYPMIRLAEIESGTYEPYMGEVFTIDLDGTRYGGVLDVDAGTLTIDRVGVDLGSLTWTTSGTATSGKPRMVCSELASVIKKPSSDNVAFSGISSLYAAVSNNATYNNIVGVGVSASSGNLFVYDDRYASSSDFTTAVTGQTLVYELATPQTITLTPEEVTLLWQYNTLFADTGDLSLTYDASGVLRIANAKLDIDTFKSIVAASSDFADFKTKVAAL